MCTNFSLKELTTALKHMKSFGAPGADGIYPIFLQNMGTLATSKLLELINCSWQSSEVPQSWRDSITIPIPKPGKPPDEISSFRPIALTSCASKCMERMIATRCYHHLEANNLLSPLQAGFRKCRSTEDQVIAITQTISDGLQKKPSERSILVTLDYSKAFDTVWRLKLMDSLLSKNVPLRFAK